MAKAKKKPEPYDLTFDEFVKGSPELTVLTDHPLNGEEIEESFANDPFNFRYKLGPVFDILRFPKTETPAAILISGGWGTGKTSAMKWLEHLLNKWNKKVSKGEIEKKADEKLVKVRPVWFYPWKYDNKEDVRRGLIAEVIINSIDVKTATTQTVINAAKQFGLFLGKSFLHVLASIKLKAQVSTEGGPVKPQVGTEVDLASIKEILAEYQQAAHPEKAFLNEFERELERWVKDTLGQGERMVIFIDDLDRCMPDIALQVLEALKLYLNIEKRIFVLAVDKDVVEKLVVEHYKRLGLVRVEEKDRGKPETEEEKAEAELNKARRQQDEQKAKMYLSKMFQVEIELSPKEEQVRDFLDKYLAKIPYWSEKLSQEHQKLFRGLVLTLAGRNPREVKRILNSALMSGAGAKMIKIEKGKPELKFEQGLQDFFIRRVLQKPQYERLASMIDTDEGRKFLRVWSQVTCKVYAEKPEKLSDVLPEYLLKNSHTEMENE